MCVCWGGSREFVVFFLNNRRGGTTPGTNPGEQMGLWGPVLVLALCVAAATALPVFQFVAGTSELLPMCRALAPVASNEAAAQCAALPLALGSDPCALKCTTEAIERGYA